MKLTLPVLLGLLVVLAGISILVSALFHIHLPLVRSAVALLLVYAGVRLLLGGWQPAALHAGNRAVVMADQRFTPTQPASQLKYDIIFGRGVVDLTQLPRPERPMSVEVNAVFGSAVVRIDPSWPLEVEGSAAFGQVRMPDRTATAFGNTHYQPKAGAEPLLRLRLNAVFASGQVVEDHPPQAMRPIDALAP